MRRRMPGMLAATGLALALASGVVLAKGGSWKKDGTKGGVTVWTRDKDGSEVCEVKATAIIDAAPVEIWAFVGDADEMKSIMPELDVMKSLGSCGDTCEYIYQRVSHPLLQDRHAVLEMRWKEVEKDGEITYRRWWKLTKAKPLPSCGAVPFEKLSGSWTLQPLDGGTKTRATYKNHTEIGGVVPAGFMSDGLVKNTYKLLKKLRAKF